MGGSILSDMARAKTGRGTSAKAKSKAKKVTKKKATKKKATKKQADDTAKVYKRLRSMVHRYRKKLDVYQDDEKGYGANARSLAPNKKPYFFAGAGMRKGYVSYYLFPVYCKPQLLEGISPALKKRMQGKSCFNFKTVDEELFAELDALTQKGYDDFVKDGIIK